MYSHRQGETEPPTRPGWYWVKKIRPYRGEWQGTQMRYVTSLSKNYQRRQAYRMDSIGQEYLDDIGKTLQWWGPVVPPWEEDGEQTVANQPPVSQGA